MEHSPEISHGHRRVPPATSHLPQTTLRCFGCGCAVGIDITELAQGLEPFQTLLTHLELIETMMDGLHTGILWLNVQETESLRGLHERVNRELTARFGNARVEFDGAEYHFHMTVAIGGQPIETYRRILDEFKDRFVNLQCMIRELVMFVYDERTEVNARYMTYRILPLSL